MKPLVLTGSKEEILRKVAAIEEDILEIVVFIDKIQAATHEISDADESGEDIFEEMEPYTVHVSDVDDSRDAIYTRMEGE